jgi:hypothetical protein
MFVSFRAGLVNIQLAAQTTVWALVDFLTAVSWRLSEP